MSVNGKRLKLCALTLLGACVSFGDCPNALADTPMITTIKEGEAAPFDGDLYPIEDSIRMALALDDSEARCAAELNHLRELQRIEINTLQQVTDNRADADQERLEVLELQLEDRNAWYREPAFVATVATVVTVATMLAATVLIKSTVEAVP